MNFEEIRRLPITALFADDKLTAQLVLKGGNALNLVYGLNSRTSLDLDFSLESDFDDIEEARERLYRALHNRFDSVGYRVFDESLEPKPDLAGVDQKPWWGGYELKFGDSLKNASPVGIYTYRSLPQNDGCRVISGSSTFIALVRGIYTSHKPP